MTNTEIYNYINSRLPVENFNTGWRKVSDTESLLFDYLWQATLHNNDGNSVAGFLHSQKRCFAICFNFTSTPHMEYVTDEEGKSNLVMDWSKPNTWTFSETYVLDFEITWRDAVLQALSSIDMASQVDNLQLFEGSSSINFDFYTAALSHMSLRFQANPDTNKSLIRLHEALLEFKVLLKAAKKAQYFP